MLTMSTFNKDDQISVASTVEIAKMLDTLVRDLRDLLSLKWRGKRVTRKIIINAAVVGLCRLTPPQLDQLLGDWIRMLDREIDQDGPAITDRRTKGKNPLPPKGPRELDGPR